MFLGWSGGKVLIVYFGDTLASMYAVSVLAAYAATQREPEFQAWIKDDATPLPREIYLVVIVLACAAGTAALELTTRCDSVIAGRPGLASLTLQHPRRAELNPLRSGFPG